jgi:anti-sigma factor RsiW
MSMSDSESAATPTLDELLAAHAAGRLPPPVALVVASHLALSPESRRRHRAYEAVGGALLEAIEPAPLAPTPGTGSWRGSTTRTGSPGESRVSGPAGRRPGLRRGRERRSWADCRARCATCSRARRRVCAGAG